MRFDHPLSNLPEDDEAPSGIVVNPHSSYGKELRKWEQHRTDLVPHGTTPGNPYVYRPYPKMLYKAQRLPNGQMRCLAALPDPYQYEHPGEYQHAVLWMESFNKSCTRIVDDEAQERAATRDGWRDSPATAMHLEEQVQRDIGNAAAEARAVAKTMSTRAQVELAKAEALSHQHVTDVTRRGRPVTQRPEDNDVPE